jgi:hypothetical protein
MRRLAVTRVKGADAVKDRDDSYVQALFDLCLADAGGGVGPDPIALVMSGGVPARLGDAGQQVEKAWGGMVDHLTTAWKTPANGAKPN